MGLHRRVDVRVGYAVFVVACSAGTAACQRHVAATVAHHVVRFTTGTPGGGFQPLGRALAAAYERILPDISVQVRESPGSVSNVEAMQQATADFGFAFADVAYMAYAGRLTAGSAPFDRLRGIAVLQLTPLQVVVRAGSGIRDVGDLRGRRIGLGPPGSGTALTATLVLQAFGMDLPQVDAKMLRFNDAARSLVDGRLDAMFVNASYPAASVLSVAEAGGRLLEVGGPHIERLRLEYPFLRPTMIPADTYPHHPSPVHTIGVDNLFVCRRDLDDTTVYRLTKAFFDVLPQLAAEEESLRSMDLEQAPATPIPLHHGAARYYRERQLRR